MFNILFDTCILNTYVREFTSLMHHIYSPPFVTNESFLINYISAILDFILFRLDLILFRFLFYLFFCFFVFHGAGFGLQDSICVEFVC